MYRKRYTNRGGAEGSSSAGRGGYGSSRGGRGGSRGGYGGNYNRGDGSQSQQAYVPRDGQQQQQYNDPYYAEGGSYYEEDYADYYDETSQQQNQQYSNKSQSSYQQQKPQQYDDQIQSSSSQYQPKYQSKQQPQQQYQHRQVTTVEKQPQPAYQQSEDQRKEFQQSAKYLPKNQTQPSYQEEPVNQAALTTQSSVFVPKKKQEEEQKSYEQSSYNQAAQSKYQPKYAPKDQYQQYQEEETKGYNQKQSYQQTKYAPKGQGYQQKSYEDTSYQRDQQPKARSNFQDSYYEENGAGDYSNRDTRGGYQGRSEGQANKNQTYQDSYYDDIDYYQDYGREDYQSQGRNTGNNVGDSYYMDYGAENEDFDEQNDNYYDEVDTQGSRTTNASFVSQTRKIIDTQKPAEDPYKQAPIKGKGGEHQDDQQKSEVKRDEKKYERTEERKDFKRGGDRGTQQTKREPYQKDQKRQQEQKRPDQRYDAYQRSNQQEDEEEKAQQQLSLNEISNMNYAQGRRDEGVSSPCVVMMVAEKPSIALSIAESLSNNYEQKKGIARQIPVYTFKGNFQGKTAHFRVTSVAGHVYNRDFPLDYQDRRMDPLALFDAPTVRKLDGSSRTIAKHLQTVSSGIDFMVLWLDCDKEGENICFEVLDICRKNIPKSKRQRVFRAKFSSIAKKDIQTAFDTVKAEPSYNESVSVDARQVMDLKIGVAFSRFQTQYFQYLLRGQHEIRMITYGPCQTPTLGFCVDQAEKIKKFIPEPYWSIETVIADKDRGKSYSLKWGRGKIYDRTVTTIVHSRIACFDSAEVIDVQKSKAVQGKPQGLNTVKMLKVASKTYGMSAHDTMKTAEHLYLRGYITYPRTESTTYSANFNFDEILQQHQQNSEWGSYATRLLNGMMVKPKKGVDAGDHPPITPVKSASRASLGEREWKLYNFITRNFFGSISPDASYDQVKVLFQVGNKESIIENFKLKGNILVEHGFLEIMPWLLAADKEIPVFKIGQQVEVRQIKITEGKTQAPGYLTEAKLISRMEKNGIGTDASIPTHINNIIERKFVTVLDPGRQLVPTPLGSALVKGYCQIDPELVLPSIRQNIEKSCELIAKGKADFAKILAHVLTCFRKKFEFFRANISSMEKILSMMLRHQQGRLGKELMLTNQIQLDDESKRTAINFCIRCFTGYLNIQYHNSKGWGLKCDSCTFRVGVLSGAARVVKEDTKCEECDSYQVSATYMKDSPFPGKRSEHTGCLFCDSLLNQTVVKFFSKKKKSLEEMTEEERKVFEEKRKKKEEKQKKKEEKKLQEAKSATTKTTGGDAKTDDATKKKKKKNKAGGAGGPNQMSAQDMMNEFIKKQLIGNK